MGFLVSNVKFNVGCKYNGVSLMNFCKMCGKHISAVKRDIYCSEDCEGKDTYND